MQMQKTKWPAEMILTSLNIFNIHMNGVVSSSVSQWYGVPLVKTLGNVV